MKEKFKLILPLLLLILVITACGNDEVNSEIIKKMQNEDQLETNMDEKVADFSFINQDEETVSLDDLKGEYWITDMVFTNCTTVCLPMTSNMKALQDDMLAEGLEHIKLISFSVDPENDTPEVLRDYAEEYEANLDNWSFLTGYDFDEMKELSIKTFRSMLQEPMPGDDQVTHGTRFYLVNPKGEVIKNYDGLKATTKDEIIEDLKTLQ